MSNEIWKAIKDYEGLYEVSSLGRVKSLARKITDKNGRIIPVHEKYLTWNKAQITKRHPVPHYTVELWKENKRKRIPVHRLVADAFVPNTKGKPQVNHMDGNPANNMVENLEWVTNSENVKHAYDNGLRKKHSEKPIVMTNKITGERLYFKSCSEAANFFKITRAAVRSPLKGYGRSKGCCGYTVEYQ